MFRLSDLYIFLIMLTREQNMVQNQFLERSPVFYSEFKSLSSLLLLDKLLFCVLIGEVLLRDILLWLDDMSLKVLCRQVMVRLQAWVIVLYFVTWNATKRAAAAAYVDMEARINKDQIASLIYFVSWTVQAHWRSPNIVSI